MYRSRWFRRAARAALALIVLASPVASIHAQGTPPGSNTLKFLFAAVAQPAKTSDPTTVPLETHCVLNSGDRIKFLLEPVSEAYFYLFHLDPHGRLSLLFPPDLKKSPAPAGQAVYVPRGSLWYELDAASGAEKFFFLASKERLAQLEELAARHVALKEHGEAALSAKAVLDEISRLSKQHRSLSAPAEKPVRIAGKFRAPSKADSAALPDITPFAKEIAAQGFYSKTFSIEHR
jgi:hypothetical protein